MPASWRLSSFENGTPGSLPPPDALTAEGWRELHFTAAELAQAQISGMSSDPDWDGLSNLLEFGLARRPLEAEAKAPFQVAVEVIEVAGVPHHFLTLSFDRPVNSELQYALQKSSDLSDWKTLPLIRVRASVDAATQIESITVREKQPMPQPGLAGSIQMRIRFSL